MTWKRTFREGRRWSDRVCETCQVEEHDRCDSSLGCSCPRREVFEDCYRPGAYERDPRVVQVTNTCYRAGEAGRVLFLGVGIGYPYPGDGDEPYAGWWLAVTDTAVVGEYERLPEALAALLGKPQMVPVELAAQAWPDDPAWAVELLEVRALQDRVSLGGARRGAMTHWLNLPINGPLLVLMLLCALAALVVLLTAGSTGAAAGLVAVAAAAVGLSWLPVYRQRRPRKPTT